jgi:hypothetical protein
MDWNTMTEAQKADAIEALEKKNAMKVKERRYWVAQSILMKKAIDKGIEVSEEEIDAEMKIRFK